MESIFKAWKSSRALLAPYFEKYDLEQLNHVPKGFNNNLIWNLGHIIVAQQGLIYKGSGLEPYLSQDLRTRYQPGTKPETEVTRQEVDELQELLTSLIAKTEADFDKGLFQTYNERTTATGFHLSSLMDAFEFNNYHEALHLGAMMAIRKFI